MKPRTTPGEPQGGLLISEATVEELAAWLSELDSCAVDAEEWEALASEICLGEEGFSGTGVVSPRSMEAANDENEAVDGTETVLGTASLMYGERPVMSCL